MIFEINKNLIPEHILNSYLFVYVLNFKVYYKSNEKWSDEKLKIMLDDLCKYVYEHTKINDDKHIYIKVLDYIDVKGDTRFRNLKYGNSYKI